MCLTLVMCVCAWVCNLLVVRKQIFVMYMQLSLCRDAATCNDLLVRYCWQIFKTELLIENITSPNTTSY